jgi:hypothetical protein
MSYLELARRVEERMAQSKLAKDPGLGTVVPPQRVRQAGECTRELSEESEISQATQPADRPSNALINTAASHTETTDSEMARKFDAFHLPVTASDSGGARNLALNAKTRREVLGSRPSPDALAKVRQEVATALAALERGIATGILPAPQLVRGEPLGLWISLNEVARLLRAGRERRG